ncbi:hypothetical protein KJA13_02425 [Patescibacteria group bacterium]|nr:hypothetical protein [Patescibacteria group bacterium]
MRGRAGKITIRFDPQDLVELQCHCDYDPKLCGKEDEDNKVMLVRKIEVQNPDGSWSPYPSVTWLDGVEGEDDEQLVTRAFIKKTDEEGFDIMSSWQGVPDGTLMCAAKGAGIHTETIYG